MPEHEGYIVEFITVGGSVKVTAIDPGTGREVSIVGAPGASRDDLAQLAVRKLLYVTGKENG